MSSAAKSTAEDAKSSSSTLISSSSLIPLSTIDAVTQRLYLASAFILLEVSNCIEIGVKAYQITAETLFFPPLTLFLQTYKLYEVVAAFYLDSSSWSLLGSFLLFNLFFVTVASRLRVPRLDFSRAKWTILFTLLGIFDWAACGGWRTLLNLTRWIPVFSWIAQTLFEMWSNAFNRELSLSEHRVRLKDLIEPKSHILGQHTIHVLPFSTASFTPTISTSALSSCFCLDSSDSKSEITIPILFNNTDPHWLSYSITPFEGDAEPSIYNVTIQKNSLISIGESSDSRKMTNRREDQLDLELEDADDQRGQEDVDSRAMVQRSSRQLGQRSNSREDSHGTMISTHHKGGSSNGLMFHLPIKHIGRVRLERVLDRNRYDARLSRSEVIVVECPTMSFDRQMTSSSKIRKNNNDFKHHCPGEEAVLDVNVRGLAPLELTYSRRVDTETISRHKTSERGQRETYTISHISGNSSTSNPLSFEDDRAERLAVILKGRHSSQQVFDWANARDVKLPVTIEFPTPGRYHYELDQVKDACGNAFRVDSSLPAWHREIEVHSRRQAFLANLDSNLPINLLQGGPKKEIYIEVDRHQPEEGPFVVQVKYQGVEEDWQRNITISGQRTGLAIDKPGSYSLEGVQGHYCAGDVGSPWLCTAQEIPPPTSIIEVDPIQDQCAGPVGVKAMAILSGSPPFRLTYSIQPKGKTASTHVRSIDRTREELEFRPTADGEITYTFLSLSDANYKDIKLDGPTFTQILHPIAKAFFSGSQGIKGPAVVLYSCEGNTSTANIQLEGVGPFDLSYAVRTSGGELAYTKQVKGINSDVFPLKVEVPSQIADKGGRLTVTLTSIKDAKGCERPLTTSDLSIDVKRSKPTISFVETRETFLLDGGEVRLPVRLSGEGPWNVRYRREADVGRVIEAKFHKSEASLVVDKPGNYILEEVSDQHCPGHVVATKKSHLVTIRPRPNATFETDSSSQVDKSGMTMTRKPVCMGSPDSVNVRLNGHFPIAISYQHRLPSRDVLKEKFTSAQNVTSIELFTGVAGQHTYELTSVGDAIYSDSPLASKDLLSKIIQDVLPLPDASFSSRDQASSKNGLKPNSLCVGDSLTRQSNALSNVVLTLTGKAPFTIDVDIKDSRGDVKKSITRSGITTHQVELDIPSDEFVFDKTGMWSVAVTGIKDGNGCQRAIEANTGASLGEERNGKQFAKSTSVSVQVVETANISALDLQTDHCVGETIEYVLLGSPPWTVVYDFEGSKLQAAVRTSTFARVAERPGKLQVKQIAHQQNKCSNNVENQSGMTKIIHALPSVHVREGKHYIEDLREGNQAEIVFKLKGEPPFSFSIQRTQAIDRFQRPIVLESHKVTGITNMEYRLFTSEEGTWSVTWLRDRYCEVSLDPLPSR